MSYKPSPEYFRQYHKRKRDELIQQMGGKCCKCEGTDRLAFDHIDPKEKSFCVSTMLKSKPMREAEAKKCQLLCYSCHLNKTRDEGSLQKNKPFGERIGSSKLTDSAVRDVRQLHREGMRGRDIAKKYGVSRAAIWCIIHGRTWKHVL